jgi:hypothetical protein
MTDRGISGLSVEDLVERYAEFSIRQGQALDLVESSSKVNRLGDLVDEVDNELKRRTGDQRSALMKLFSHSDDWVRFNAATSLISIAPTQARQVLQIIADSDVYPQAFHARMYLRNLNSGFFKSI